MNKNRQNDFPIFEHDADLVYLDSAATTLKTKSVIQALDSYYQEYSSNIHRGVYPIAEKASLAYESARQTVADFIHAEPHEIIFTRGTTEGLNLILETYLRENIQPGDTCVCTLLDHHAGFVTLQQLAKRYNADFIVLDIDSTCSLNETSLTEKITPQTKVVILPYVTNVTGTELPIRDIIKRIRSSAPNAIVIVDAAQAISHIPVDVVDLDCDALVFSGHKMFGPTGIGVAFVRSQLMDLLPPYQYGGDMISDVSVEDTRFAQRPHMFEAGTPHIAGAIGLAEAVKYIQEVGFDSIQKITDDLYSYLLNEIDAHFGSEIDVIGRESQYPHHGIVSFTYGSYHPHDIASIVAEKGVAVRAGHHCAMPLHKHLGLVATTRISLHVYNTRSDIDTCIQALKYVKSIL